MAGRDMAYSNKKPRGLRGFIADLREIRQDKWNEEEKRLDEQYEQALIDGIKIRGILVLDQWLRDFQVLHIWTGDEDSTNWHSANEKSGCISRQIEKCTDDITLSHTHADTQSLASMLQDLEDKVDEKVQTIAETESTTETIADLAFSRQLPLIIDYIKQLQGTLRDM